MTPKVDIHILTFQEAEILTFMLRHWVTFASRIVVHDAGSTDGTQEIAARFGAEVHWWDAGEKFNDIENTRLKNDCWRDSEADLVAVVDADELLYFPQGTEETLAAYVRLGAAVIKAHGFEMFSPTFPSGRGQIYEEVKDGARDDKWYAKPALFSPRLVAESGFGIGAHESNPVLKSGRRLYVGAAWPKANPPTYLLHFHHGIGPIERLAARLDSKRARLSDENRRHGWGNLKDGAIHAQEKLDFIRAGLMRVIP